MQRTIGTRHGRCDRTSRTRTPPPVPLMAGFAGLANEADGGRLSLLWAIFWGALCTRGIWYSSSGSLSDGISIIRQILCTVVLPNMSPAERVGPSW